MIQVCVPDFPGRLHTYEIAFSAIDGTVGILRAVKNKAPTVKRVVVTSSGAAVMDFSQPKTYTYTEVTTWLIS